MFNTTMVYNTVVTANEKNGANSNFLMVLKATIQTNELTDKGIFGATQKPDKVVTFRIFGSNQVPVGTPVAINPTDWKITEKLSPTTGFYLKYLDALVPGQGSFSSEKPADYQAPTTNNAVNTSATTQDDLPF